VLQSNAFVLRPQLIRRDSPPPTEPAPPRAAASAAPLRAPERREPPPVERRDPAPAAEQRRAPSDPRLGARKPPSPDPFPPRPPPAPKPPAADPFVAKAPPAAPKIEGDDTSFTLDAPGPNWVRGKPRGGAEAQRMHELLRNAFTPTRPKHDAAMFSGRFREMQRIIAAIEEERAHVVVYGERGSGKTSLCNILAGKAGEAGYFVLQYACSTGVSFEEIFRTFLRRIPASFLAEGLGLGTRRVDSFAQLLPEGAFGISDLIEVFGRVHDRHVILIVDEYDRVSDETVKAKLAELIKIMSDASVPVTMLLIGVADDVRDLFGKHPSLQRALVTVPMPMMSRRDLEGLIAAGEAHAGLAFAPAVREEIIDFAQGLPYQAQLLCLFSARNAVRRNVREVEREDLRYAIERAAEEAESRIKDAYGLAIGMPTESAFEDVLFHAARAHSDEFGTFTAADVSAAGPAAEGESSLLALQYPLKKLAEPERGAVLRRLVTVTGQRYQFCSQMFRNYVLVNQALRRGLI
jgi:Cdc6-like AAA superfamily ATPase